MSASASPAPNRLLARSNRPATATGGRPPAGRSSAVARRRRSIGRTRRGYHGPRLLRTETVTPPRARLRAKRSTCRSEGREKGMPAASFSGIRFTFARNPCSSRTSRAASPAVSLTPRSRTILERDPLAVLQRKPAAGGDQIGQALPAAGRNQFVPHPIGCGMQRDGQIRDPRFVAQPGQRRQDAKPSTGSPAVA